MLLLILKIMVILSQLINANVYKISFVNSEHFNGEKIHPFRNGITGKLHCDFTVIFTKRSLQT